MSNNTLLQPIKVLALESPSDRRLRLLKEAKNERKAKTHRVGRACNHNSILQTGTPSKVLNLCIYNEQKELERYLDTVRANERTASDMDELDQTYNILTEEL